MDGEKLSDSAKYDVNKDKCKESTVKHRRLFCCPKLIVQPRKEYPPCHQLVQHRIPFHAIPPSVMSDITSEFQD